MISLSILRHITLYILRHKSPAFIPIFGPCLLVAPDLVPDPLKVKLSLEGRFYIDHLPMYYLDCAAEENCLSRSAYAPGLSTSDER